MAYTYSGPSVSAAFTTGVFNIASGLADSKTAEATTEFGNARAQTAIIPQPPLMSLQNLNPGLTPVVLPPPVDLGLVLAGRANLLTDLVADIDNFLATYFPGIDAAVSSARAALELMLAGNNFAGGRDSARLRLEQAQARQLRDMEESDDALIRKFAARGYRLPPGALMYELGLARKADLHDVADQMFRIDEGEAAREAQNLQTALRLLVNTRARAMTAFSEYLGRASLARYDAAMAETERTFRYQELFLLSLGENALGVNRAAAMQVRQMQANYEVSKNYLESLDRLVEQQADLTISAAKEYASLIGSQAAATFNALQGSAGIAASEQF